MTSLRSWIEHKYSESISIPLSALLSGTIAFNFSCASLGLGLPAVHSSARCPFTAHLIQSPNFLAHLTHSHFLRTFSCTTNPLPFLIFLEKNSFSLGVSFWRLILLLE